MSWLGAFVAGFIVAGVATPAGVSGAVLLLPVQVSLLGIPSPAVTPTNLLYNVISTPSGVLRYRRSGGLDAGLAGRLVAGTVPGVVLGAVIRVHWIPGEQGFRLVVAAVLIPLGVLLLIRNGPSSAVPDLAERWLVPSAFAVGVVGGVYGVGGGSIIAPILLLAGYSAYRVAPAALLSTMAASVVGVISFALLSLGDPAASATPDWATGIAAGAGGAVGAYAGAAAQPRVPERALRRLLGVLVIAIGVRYAHLSLTG